MAINKNVNILKMYVEGFENLLSKKSVKIRIFLHVRK
jgi:hypothetical protein